MFNARHLIEVKILVFAKSNSGTLQAITKEEQNGVGRMERKHAWKQAGDD